MNVLAAAGSGGPQDAARALKAAVTGALAFLTGLWGWFGWLVVIWCLLMLADWLVGSALAAREGRWSSARLREGAWHKAGMVLVFFIALVTDWLIGLTLEQVPGLTLPFHYSVLLSVLVLLWYILGELGSLAEHAVATGAAVPPWLLAVLAAGRRAVDEAGDKLLPQGQETYDEGEASRR